MCGSVTMCPLCRANASKAALDVKRLGRYRQLLGWTAAPLFSKKFVGLLWGVVVWCVV